VGAVNAARGVRGDTGVHVAVYGLVRHRELPAFMNPKLRTWPKDSHKLSTREVVLAVRVGVHPRTDNVATGIPSRGEVEHAPLYTEDQVEGRLLVDVVVLQGEPVLQLPGSKNQTLVVHRDTLMDLYLTLHNLNAVRGLHVQSNGLACQCLDEDLHD
jgi:hypothetical protein